MPWQYPVLTYTLQFFVAGMDVQENVPHSNALSQLESSTDNLKAMDQNGTSASKPYAADLGSIVEARKRIAPHIHITPVVTSSSLDALAGCKLFFKCELLQKGYDFSVWWIHVMFMSRVKVSRLSVFFSSNWAENYCEIVHEYCKIHLANHHRRNYCSLKMECLLDGSYRCCSSGRSLALKLDTNSGSFSVLMYYEFVCMDGSGSMYMKVFIARKRFASYRLWRETQEAVESTEVLLSSEEHVMPFFHFLMTMHEKEFLPTAGQITQILNFKLLNLMHSIEVKLLYLCLLVEGCNSFKNGLQCCSQHFFYGFCA